MANKQYNNQTKEQKRLANEMNDIEITIGKILRYGVIISATIMIIGFITYLITGNGGYPTHKPPTSFTTIINGLIHFKADAIMMIGMFCLILTPILRVIVSIYSFYKEQDRLYVYITTFVLVILIIGFIIGIIN